MSAPLYARASSRSERCSGEYQSSSSHLVISSPPALAAAWLSTSPNGVASSASTTVTGSGKPSSARRTSSCDAGTPCSPSRTSTSTSRWRAIWASADPSRCGRLLDITTLTFGTAAPCGRAGRVAWRRSRRLCSSLRRSLTERSDASRGPGAQEVSNPASPASASSTQAGTSSAYTGTPAEARPRIVSSTPARPCGQRTRNPSKGRSRTMSAALRGRFAASPASRGRPSSKARSAAPADGVRT